MFKLIISGIKHLIGTFFFTLSIFLGFFIPLTKVKEGKESIVLVGGWFTHNLNYMFLKKRLEKLRLLSLFA